MHDELEHLLDLQSKDLTLLEVDARLAAIGDEVRQLDGELEAARGEAQVARTRVADGVKRREELELKIEGHRTAQDLRRQRLEGARNAREAQALLTEVDTGRTVLVREEADWVKLADQVQELERGAESADARIETLKEEQASERERLSGESKDLTAEREAALTAREASAQAVERTILARYDRLRSVRTEAVVVALHGDACGACFTAVPRNRRSQIRAGLLLDNCEACGVIVYAETEGVV
jgi:predicted  nucleic acid-binding Zn-ribbon protein